MERAPSTGTAPAGHRGADGLGAGESARSSRRPQETPSQSRPANDRLLEHARLLPEGARAPNAKPRASVFWNLLFQGKVLFKNTQEFS